MMLWVSFIPLIFAVTALAAASMRRTRDAARVEA
ncbi:hypothetical protein HNQ49_001703 [Parapusillimonas granuli]|nr:hypothetical protein [Parapusillimonas granuli]